MTEGIKKEDLEMMLREISRWFHKLCTDMEDNRCNTVSILCGMQLMGMNLDNHAKNIMEGEETVKEAADLMECSLLFLKKLGES